ncbi:copper amine oxidase N-terminal domain-containing protein [Desulfoscipio gibsoniae]
MNRTLKAYIVRNLYKLLTVLVVSGMFVLIAEMPASANVETAMELRMEEIDYVAAGQADLSYVPLFYEREEDRPALKIIVDAVNVMSKHPAQLHKQDPWEAFFDTEFVLQLKDGTSIVLTYASQDIVNLSLPGQEPFGVDPVIAVEYSNLIGLFIIPTYNIPWPDTMMLGKMYPVQGKTTESKEINIFIGPLRGVSGGNNYEGVNGRFFPNKDDLYIASIPVKFGRYDTSVVIPPFGEALNGEMVPIAPGQWELYTVASNQESSNALTVAPNPNPLLTVNGRFVPSDMPPRIEQGRLLVPLRVLGSALGVAIEWDAQSNTVLVNTKATELSERFSSASIELWINGSKANPETPPSLYQNHVFVPARFIAETLGVQVKWDAELGTVNFTTKAN